MIDEVKSFRYNGNLYATKKEALRAEALDTIMYSIPPSYAKALELSKNDDTIKGFFESVLGEYDSGSFSKFRETLCLLFDPANELWQKTDDEK